VATESVLRVVGTFCRDSNPATYTLVCQSRKSKLNRHKIVLTLLKSHKIKYFLDLQSIAESNSSTDYLKTSQVLCSPLIPVEALLMVLGIVISLIFDVLCGMGFKTTNRPNVPILKPAGSILGGQSSSRIWIYQPVFQEKIQGE
ncbi:hypothetical protein PoB_007006400, partial [Plakobranchus ocellatus]